MKNKINVNIIGASATGKSTIAKIIYEALKRQGFELEIHMLDDEDR